MYMFRAADFSNPLTFSIRMYSMPVSCGTMEQMWVSASDRLSATSFCLPLRVNGWHGGDIRIVFTARVSMNLQVIFCMLLLSNLVSGKLCEYTALATVFMSTAAITVAGIALTVTVTGFLVDMLLEGLSICDYYTITHIVLIVTLRFRALCIPPMPLNSSNTFSSIILVFVFWIPFGRLSSRTEKYQNINTERPSRKLRTRKKQCQTSSGEFLSRPSHGE